MPAEAAVGVPDSPRQSQQRRWLEHHRRRRSIIRACLSGPRRTGAGATGIHRRAESQHQVMPPSSEALGRLRKVIALIARQAALEWWCRPYLRGWRAESQPSRRCPPAVRSTPLVRVWRPSPAGLMPGIRISASSDTRAGVWGASESSSSGVVGISQTGDWRGGSWRPVGGPLRGRRAGPRALHIRGGGGSITFGVLGRSPNGRKASEGLSNSFWLVDRPWLL